MRDDRSGTPLRGQSRFENPAVRPVTPEIVTPTDIVVTVSDLIRSAGLNLWDVSMWFNRTKR